MIKEEQQKKQQEIFRRQMELESKLGFFQREAEVRTLPAPLFRSAKFMQSTLDGFGVVKVKHGEDITGVVIEPKLYEELLEYIEILENRLDEQSLQGLIEARKDTEDFSSGAELATGALKYLHNNEATIRRFLDDDTN